MATYPIVIIGFGLLAFGYAIAKIRNVRNDLRQKMQLLTIESEKQILAHFVRKYTLLLNVFFALCIIAIPFLVLLMKKLGKY